jgi:isopenicillin N synthase-like dioxygenase
MLPRFLWADDTKGALQVFLQRPGLLVKTPGSSGGVADEVVEQGATWINADPMKGCVVCNIGESECSGGIIRRRLF